MDVQVFETMNLIVHVEVASEVVGTGNGCLLIQQRHRVLRCVVVGHLCPVRIGNVLSVNQWLVESTCDILIGRIIDVDRTGGIYRQGCTNSAAGVGIEVFLRHVLGGNNHVQVVVQQTRREVKADVGTIHLRTFYNTFRNVETSRDTIRNAPQAS